MQKLCCLAIGVFLISSFVNPDQLQAATYTFTPSTVINSNSPAPLQIYTENTFPSISLSIQDSAVQSGFFSANYTNLSGAYSGEYSSLINFNIGDIISISSNAGSIGVFRANLLFDSQDNVINGAISFSSDQFKIDLGGSAGLFQGTFASANNVNTGFVGGTLVTVPEPTSLFLLSGSMVCAVWLRRHRVRTH